MPADTGGSPREGKGHCQPQDPAAQLTLAVMLCPASLDPLEEEAVAENMVMAGTGVGMVVPIVAPLALLHPS